MKQSKIQRYLIDDPQKKYPYPILYWLDSNPRYMTEKKSPWKTR